jgi:periplasmic protein TonB
VRKMLMAAGLAVAIAAGAAAQGQVYNTRDKGVTSPVLIREVKPKYTEDAMRRKVQGTVEVSAVVRENGVPDDFTVIRSLDPDLDQEAINAAQQWRFKPGLREGQPVAVKVNIELTFTLRDKK